MGAGGQGRAGPGRQPRWGPAWAGLPGLTCSTGAFAPRWPASAGGGDVANSPNPRVRTATATGFSGRPVMRALLGRPARRAPLAPASTITPSFARLPVQDRG